MNELEEWMKECMNVFPSLKGIKIECKYRKLPKNTLGRIKGKVFMKRDIDVETLLIEGKAKVKIKREKPREYEIEINEKLKGIKKEVIRKQIVQHTIIHELLHIENDDLISLTKDYKRRKKKKLHVKEFKNEVFKRYNEMRKLNGLPPIERKEDFDMAIGKIMRELEI